MQHEQYGAKLAPQENENVKQPELSYLNERFEKVLVQEGELISQIEDKVHNILNRRGPEKSIPPSVKEMKDFSASLTDKITSVESYNVRLDGILRHLREII